jgi:hypothetical protein
LILIDANLLLYAYDSASPRHEAARTWFEAVLSEETDVRFGLVTLLAFLRLGTDPRVFERPLGAADAVALVESWLARPNVSIALPSERHWSRLADLSEASKARGALMMDAHLATLTIEHGARLATTDRDFMRFAGLRFVDPLAG